MLYIEKHSCPEAVSVQMQEIFAEDAWNDIPDPADHEITLDEKRRAVANLRDYFDMLNKDILRGSLLQEQHYLCAYCMSPISNIGLHTTVEHWAPLSKGKSNALDYQNMLATCKGGSDVIGLTRSQRVICCDARKGDNDSITIDPRNRAMMEGITYSNDGIINYQDSAGFNGEKIQHDIDDILYLNGTLDEHRFCRRDTTTQLVKNRKDVYKNTDAICLELYEKGLLTVEFLQKKIDDCLRAEHREAFAGVSVFVYSVYLKILKNRAS